MAAPAARVWELLGDFGGVAKWGGSMLQSCTVEGSGVGAVRTIGLPGGASIQERCEAHDVAGRALTYAIIGKSPLPIRGYLSTCRVVETGANFGTRLAHFHSLPARAVAVTPDAMAGKSYDRAVIKGNSQHLKVAEVRASTAADELLALRGNSIATPPDPMDE